MENPSKANPNVVILLYFLLKILPMIISGISIYLGYRLFIMGVSGEASLSIESDTVSGQLINAAPGLFFATGGIVALIFSILKGAKLKLSDADGSAIEVMRNKNQ